MIYLHRYVRVVKVIFSYEPLTMGNVLAKRYFTDKEHILEAEKEFLAEVFSNQEIVVKGPLVYMIEYTFETGILSVWFMLSIANECGSKDKTFKFDSYFGLEQAICCKIYPDELQENSEQIYNKMQEKCNEDGVRMISPVYFAKNLLEKEGFYSLYAAIS